jgi:hypothetical protein
MCPHRASIQELSMEYIIWLQPFSYSAPKLTLSFRLSYERNVGICVHYRCFEPI